MVVQSILVPVLGFLGLALGYPAQTTPSLRGDPDEIDWAADIDELRDLLLNEHLDIGRLIDPDRIREAAADLRAQVDDLDEARIVSGLSSLAGLPNDGHTHLSTSQERAGFRFFPFRGMTFAEGYFVLDVHPDHAGMAGKRLVQVAGKDIEDVFAALDEATGGENRFFRRRISGGRIRLAELLHALGILASPDSGVFTVEDAEGVRTSHTLSALPRAQYAEWSRSQPSVFSWAPEEIRGRGERYWFTLLDDGTLYFYCDNLVGNDRKAAIEFSEKLERFARNNDFERFVLDLRGNGGGSANNAVPFVRVFQESPKINRRGRFFTLVGPKTYSAAALFCGMLQNRTRTLFVGEPTGQGVNLFGDATEHTLTSSGLLARISQRWWQCDIDEDPRQWMTIDLPVPFRYADWSKGHNAALAAAIAHVPEETDVARVTPEQARRYVGRYRFNDWRELVIEDDGGGLRFELHDLIDGPNWLAEVVSDLRPVDGGFRTDLTGVVLLAEPDGVGPLESVTFDWRGIEKRCTRVAEDYRFPIQRVDQGNITGNESGPDLRWGYTEPWPDPDAAAISSGLEEMLANPEPYAKRNMVEARLNAAGYRLLRADRIDLATRVFRANVALFPKAWNTHDSLGEALREAGDLSASLSAYRRSVELNPGNAGGERAIRELERELD